MHRRSIPSLEGAFRLKGVKARGSAPEAADARLARSHPELEPRVRAHLAHLYGTLAEEVLAPARDDPALLEPLHPDAPDLVAQAVYARTHEWAVSDEDVLRRRTTGWLAGRQLPV